MSGIVVFFNRKLGWGFIQTDGVTDFFVHFKDIEMNGYKYLTTGDSVEFDISYSEKGPRAINVRKVAA